MLGARAKPIKILVSLCLTAKEAERDPHAKVPEGVLKLSTIVTEADESAAEAARNADARHETKIIEGKATHSKLGQTISCLQVRGPSADLPTGPRSEARRRRNRRKHKTTGAGSENSTTLKTKVQNPCMNLRYHMSMHSES